jgi:Leucine-rich repeat (LRR) protein
VENPETQIWSDVTELDLAFQDGLEDISALAGLKNLERLDLRNTQVKDVNALAGLNNLQVLHLYRTQVDVTVLAGLTNLSINR